MERLEALEDIRNDRERECNPCSEPLFHTWFMTYTADDAVSSVIQPIRVAASLGCPPAQYYMTASESGNSGMYNKTITSLDQLNKVMLSVSPLSVTPEEANLAHIPLETARGIWRKEKELLTTPGAVVNGPHLQKTGPQTVIVTSKSSTKLCVVIRKSRGMLS